MEVRAGHPLTSCSIKYGKSLELNSKHLFSTSIVTGRQWPVSGIPCSFRPCLTIYSYKILEQRHQTCGPYHHPSGSPEVVDTTPLIRPSFTPEINWNVEFDSDTVGMGITMTPSYLLGQPSDFSQQPLSSYANSEEPQNHPNIIGQANDVYRIPLAHTAIMTNDNKTELPVWTRVITSADFSPESTDFSEDTSNCTSDRSHMSTSPRVQPMRSPTLVTVESPYDTSLNILPQSVSILGFHTLEPLTRAAILNALSQEGKEFSLEVKI